MIKKRSIYKEFANRLIFATSFFVLIISFIFYGFTKTNIYKEIAENLITKAKLVSKISKNFINSDEQLKILIEKGITVDLVKSDKLNNIKITEYKKNNHHYMEVLYPFDLKSHTFIKITKNIDNADKMLHKIFSNIFILSFGGLILVIVYALAVSKTLLYPIISITKKLSNMDETTLNEINIKSLPVEFYPLSNSINHLTKRIKNHLKYQKELFVGVAHELKTPLTVIKLKAQATLRKKREISKYEEALEVIIKEVDNMNSLVSSVLNFGRAESAQLEKPITLDIIKFLKDKLNGYKIVAEEKQINIIDNFKIDSFITLIQPTLLTQIIQNFIQNSIKFSDKNKNIFFNVYKRKDELVIEVIDEGIGIGDNVDLFAPFKRVGDKDGVGLGLFLAKSAADTMGAIINIENRDDGQRGTKATLILKSNPCCTI